MQKSFIFIVSMIISLSAYGYGGGGSAKKTCDKPKFKKKTPVASSVVSPGSEFSFIASANTKLKSLKVTVKGKPVNVDIDERKNGKLYVVGRLPKSLENEFAKIKIVAASKRKCAVRDGWLLKIAKEGE